MLTLDGLVEVLWVNADAEFGTSSLSMQSSSSSLTLLALWVELNVIHR